jgi:gluconate 5-dehydrogenase
MKLAELLRIDGQVALVTGGSRGLGLQMCEALVEQGATKVVITARKAHELAEAKAHLEGLGAQVLTVPCDLADAAVIAPLVDAAMQRFGRIDILVNNAGTSWGAAAEVHPLDAWNKVIDLNQTAIFLLSQAVAVASMIPRKRGVIVNIASIAGFGGSDPHFMPTVGYNASKAAVVNMTKSFASEWAQYGIRVNAIAPGVFPSKMSKGMIDRAEQYILDHTPLKRMGTEWDLKGAIALLASPASGFITGATLPVDGGFTAL